MTGKKMRLRDDSNLAAVTLAGIEPVLSAFKINALRHDAETPNFSPIKLMLFHRQIISVFALGWLRRAAEFLEV